MNEDWMCLAVFVVAWWPLVVLWIFGPTRIAEWLNRHALARRRDK